MKKRFTEEPLQEPDDAGSQRKNVGFHAACLRLKPIAMSLRTLTCRAPRAPLYPQRQPRMRLSHRRAQSLPQ